MQYENERMEFKSQLTDDIYKEVIAFTNTDGGVTVSYTHLTLPTIA